MVSLDFLQGLTGGNVNLPRLGISPGWCPLGELDILFKVIRGDLLVSELTDGLAVVNGFLEFHENSSLVNLFIVILSY